MSSYMLSAPAGRPGVRSSEVFWYFDRDLSWLAFNERVLMEAEKDSLPLMERLAFLAIFSSNLDEFYRVRMPVIAALHKLYKKQRLTDEQTEEYHDNAKVSGEVINSHQLRYGRALRAVFDALAGHQVKVIYNEPLPEAILPDLSHYFFTQVLAFLKPLQLEDVRREFEPENNQLYMVICGAETADGHRMILLRLPTDEVSRFFSITRDGINYIIFLDDIIKQHAAILAGFPPQGCYTFKVTRDAELNLDEIYEVDIAVKIEKQIAKRDFGLATRLLHESDMPEPAITMLSSVLGLVKAVIVPGGRYHALKDLMSLPVSLPELKFPEWAPLRFELPGGERLLDIVAKQDILLHPPYDSYDTVLRFFNEAAIHPDVEHIYLTMYRVASNSKIVNALLSAAASGKKVTVLVELKARFDEANNIKWAKQLKKSGVKVLFTREDLKVHAKMGLVKFRDGGAVRRYAGLLATGNLNEGTARFYTDHILLTSDEEMLEEAEQLFSVFLSRDFKKQDWSFKHLLVAQFNLQDRYLELIDREIAAATSGMPARITIKLNNLEERVLINRLYAASNAGVEIRLIVRGICCLVPGVAGQSENITVKRIVDRYLEHGRICIFHNGGAPEVWLGSADWMNRNIYRRVEVCFPIYDERLRTQVLDMIELQWSDDVAAVNITEHDQNKPIDRVAGIRSQEAIYGMVQKERQSRMKE